MTTRLNAETRQEVNCENFSKLYESYLDLSNASDVDAARTANSADVPDETDEQPFFNECGVNLAKIQRRQRRINTANAKKRFAKTAGIIQQNLNARLDSEAQSYPSRTQRQMEDIKVVLSKEGINSKEITNFMAKYPESRFSKGIHVCRAAEKMGLDV